MPLFKLERVQFKDIQYPTIEIDPKKTTFICGPSGTGKSTLLKLLNGVASPDEGKIHYLDEEVASHHALELRRNVLLVSQSSYLFDDQTIAENFRSYYSYRELPAPSDEEIKNYLRICSLEMPLDTIAYNLSGGERQRVFIAINLSFDSDVLMLDEPTSALDERNGTALLEGVKAYVKRQNKSLIVVSHDRSLVERFADDVVELGGETV